MPLQPGPGEATSYPPKTRPPQKIQHENRTLTEKNILIDTPVELNQAKTKRNNTKLEYTTLRSPENPQAGVGSKEAPPHEAKRVE